MINQKIFEEIRKNIDSVIQQDSPIARDLLKNLLEIHPADIAQFLSELEPEELKKLFTLFPKQLKIEVFIELSEALKAELLSLLDDQERIIVLSGTPVDELTDLFDALSDEELEKYLTLLRKKVRDQVISLMQFGPESAGGIMDVNVWSLMKDFTVEKSTQLLRRLQPEQELHRIIYVTTKDNVLVGHILLEDLVLKNPKVELGDFAKKNELVVRADEDQEEVAKNMLHYGVSMVPVVGDNDQFLGIISSDTLAEIIEAEATEDVYKLSAIKPMRQPYFDTPFFRLVFERGYILVILLLAESVSGIILKRYEATIMSVLVLFIPMLMSTGGNTSHQTSALVIRGMISGEVTLSNLWRFLRREFLMAGMLAIILGITAFIRVILTTGDWWLSLIVSLACSVVVITSVTLGSSMPILLKKLNIDPMFSAGPALATLMDVLAVYIFCHISSLLASTVY